MRPHQILLLPLLLVIFLSGCEKEAIEIPEEVVVEVPEEERVRYWDESVHVGRAIDQDSTVWNFSAYAIYEPYETGLFPLNLRHYYLPDHPTYVLALDIALPRIDTLDCYTLTKAYDEFVTRVPYPSAIFQWVEHDALWQSHQLSEEKTSTVCITEIHENGLEYSGTFELHFIKPPLDPRFPWLETRWPDTLSFYDGQFRAGKYYR